MIVHQQAFGDFFGHLVTKNFTFRHTMMLSSEQGGQMAEYRQAQQPGQRCGSHRLSLGVGEGLCGGQGRRQGAPLELCVSLGSPVLSLLLGTGSSFL